MRKDNTAVVPKANRSKYGLKIICSWWAPDLEQPAKWNAKNSKLRRVSQTDPELGWPIMQLFYMQVNS